MFEVATVSIMEDMTSYVNTIEYKELPYVIPKEHLCVHLCRTEGLPRY